MDVQEDHRQGACYRLPVQQEIHVAKNDGLKPLRSGGVPRGAIAKAWRLVRRTITGKKRGSRRIKPLALKRFDRSLVRLWDSSREILLQRNEAFTPVRGFVSRDGRNIPPKVRRMIYGFMRDACCSWNTACKVLGFFIYMRPSGNTPEP